MSSPRAARVRIGIDRGAAAVRLAWVVGERWRWTRQELRRGDGAAAPTAVGALRTLVHPLRRLRYRAQVRVLAPPSHVRTVEVRVSALAQLPTAVREHLAEWFPFDPARCQFHSRLRATRPVDGGLACTLQVAACDAQALEQELAVFQALGWIPTQVYPAAIAVAAVAIAQGKGTTEPVVVVELGARRSLMAIVSRGEVLLAREPALGSDHLTEALMGRVTVGQETIQLSWEEAERLKCQWGLHPEEELSHAAPGGLSVATYRALIAPVLEQWREEIRRTITFSAQEHPEVQPRRVLLCGAGAQLRGLEAWLSHALGLTVEPLTVEPWLGQAPPLLQHSAPADRLTRDWEGAGQDRADGATVCGLVLADELLAPNLLPERPRRLRRLIRAERAAITALIMAVAGLWGAIGAAAVWQRGLARQQAQLHQRWQAFEPVHALEAEVAAQTRFVATLSNAKSVSADWFSRLAEGFPEPVRLKELHVKADGEVQMVGQAQQGRQSPEASVSALGMWLEQATVCHGVRFESSQRHAQEPTLVEFRLTCQVGR